MLGVCGEHPLTTAGQTGLPWPAEARASWGKTQGAFRHLL